MRFFLNKYRKKAGLIHFSESEKGKTINEEKGFFIGPVSVVRRVKKKKKRK